MKFAIASGKGGAGKTSIAAALVSVWKRDVLAVDTDVEAPNLHLFLKPEQDGSEQVFLSVPELDPQSCTLCKQCRDICSYRAIVLLGKKLKIFQEMCHGCGGCFEVCPADALKQGQRELGSLLSGTWHGGEKASGPFLMGKSRIGEAMTPPLLRALIKRMDQVLGTDGAADAIIDCPPGVSCPAMTVARNADCMVLAVEPTPFGFHDFRLAYEAFSQLHIPMLAVMNRSGMQGNAEGDALVRQFCHEHHLPLLGEIPFAREAAEQYAAGGLLSDISSEWRERFVRLAEELQRFGDASCVK